MDADYIAAVIASRSKIGCSNATHPYSGDLVENLREFRFDGSLYQHERLLQRPEIQALIKRGLRLRNIKAELVRTVRVGSGKDLDDYGSDREDDEGEQTGAP